MPVDTQWSAPSATLREVWTGRAGGGWLPRAGPPPPVVVGAFGPGWPSSPGRVADGINLPGNAALGDLLRVARDAHAAAAAIPMRSS